MKKYRKPIIREVSVDLEEVIALSRVYVGKDVKTTLEAEDWEHGHDDPFAKGGCWSDEWE